MTATLDHTSPSPSQNESDHDAASDQPQTPLAYAYMRVPCTIADEKVRRMELRLRACAEHLGMNLAETFCEYICGSHDAFDDLLAELQRTSTHHVIIPTFGHLATNLLLQNSFLLRLEIDAGAEVFTLTEST